MKWNKKGLQLSNIIIGMLLTVGVMLGYFAWISDGITQYGVNTPSEFNESFNTMYGVYGNLSLIINNTQQQLNTPDANSPQGFSQTFDFLGYFFNAGYRAAQTAMTAMGSMFAIVDVSISTSVLGSYGDIIKGLLLLGIIVIFIIGILLNYIIKSGRE